MTQTVVLTCPHCGRAQSQIIESGQGARKSCTNSKGGCGNTYYVQTDHQCLVERVDK